MRHKYNLTALRPWWPLLIVAALYALFVGHACRGW